MLGGSADIRTYTINGTLRENTVKFTMIPLNRGYFEIDLSGTVNGDTIRGTDCTMTRRDTWDGQPRTKGCAWSATRN